MANFTDFVVAYAAVHNPASSAADLAAIAAAQHTLWADVASHPHAYPALLDWLKARGGDDVLAAIANRGAASATPVQAFTSVVPAQPTNAPRMEQAYGAYPSAYPVAETATVYPSDSTFSGHDSPLTSAATPQQQSLGTYSQPARLYGAVAGAPAPIQALPTPSQAFPTTPAAQGYSSSQAASSPVAAPYDGYGTAQPSYPQPPYAQPQYSAEYPPTQTASPYGAVSTQPPSVGGAQPLYSGVPIQPFPVLSGTPWSGAATDTAPAPEKSKLPFIIMAGIIVLGLVAGALWWFLRGDEPTDSTKPLTADQFNTLVSTTLPNKANVAPFTASSPTKPSCTAEDNTFSHQVRIADQNTINGQGLSLKLFDTNDWAMQYANQLKTCWEQNGRTITKVVSAVVDGVTAFDMTLQQDAGVTDEVHFAVYRSVFIFTNRPDDFEPWHTWVRNVFKPAVDEVAPT